MSTRNKKNNTNNKSPQLNDLLAVKEVLVLLENHKAKEAKTACEKILKRLPNLVYANNAMGLTCLHLKEYKAAELHLKRALNADSDNYEYITSLGNVVREQGRIDESIALYNRALLLDENHKPARVGLATALQEKDDPEAVIAFFQDAAKRTPDIPGPLSHLGKAYLDAGRHNDAIATLFKSLEIKIDFAPAHVHLGMVFREMDKLDEALECHKTAIILDNDDVFTNIQMAETLVARSEFDKATHYYERLIEIAPNDPNSYTKLAGHLSDRFDRYDDAMALFDKALAIDPDYALTNNNIGSIKHDHGDIQGALKHLNIALKINPDYLTARHNLSLVQLHLGNFAEGWKNHETRLHVKERKEVYLLIHELFKIIPKWDGVSSLQGKAILLMHEQGLGDGIQFIRYAPMLTALGAKVYVHAKDALAPLFASVSDQVTIIREKDPLPKCDYAYPLMSLPFALGTDSIDKIPAPVAYLHADSTKKALWKEKIEELTPPGKTLRVGIIWAGNPKHGNDRRRSIPLDALNPLLTLPGVQIYSLQKGGGAEQALKASPNADRIIDLGKAFTDFADTAAAIDAMDLIISVDTSVTHLAGALGKKTWTLLAYVADWRWLVEGETSPWYPNMQLFRQKEAGNWAEVIARVQQALLALPESKQNTASTSLPA